MASKILTVAQILLRSSRSWTASASPVAGRYNSFCSSAAPSDHTQSQCSRGRALQSSLMGRMTHPFLIQGLRAMGNVEEYEAEAIVKVDMPGIGKDGLDVKVKNNEIHIKGKSEIDPEEDERIAERIYTGVVDLPPGFYNTDDIKATLKLGILKMVIPKLRPEEMEDPTLIPPPIGFRARSPQK
ncbi:23.5 kDa heat shock protein, mitochondrial-like [Cornus florida]|uniref:23.5 kDa heat shock protein, mitochondrial-like n=1 Tax=Cornus florida TaxID=4283 RepID=UPI00289DDFC8|nr:23.5 kDa heat shock protein, mitochondrial-like [Cornus florida]